MLERLGLEFDVEEPGVEETRMPDESPTAFVERLAREKAATAAREGVVAIGADTVVVHRGRILGKPAHPSEARTMLERLSGDSHTVFTGVAVVSWDGGPVVRSVTDRTVVTFIELTGSEIDAYVASGEPMDKAGAYAIQEAGGAFVEAISGSPSNVVGLPLHATTRLLRAAGIPVLE
jgi:septum formation protein